MPVSDSVESWLAPKLAEAPESLRRRILSAVRGAVRADPDAAPRSSLSAELASIAEELLEDAKSGPPIRDTAITLLAADAIITFAMEAEAEA